MLREPGARFFSAYTYYNKRYRIYSHYGPQGAAEAGGPTWENTVVMLSRFVAVSVSLTLKAPLLQGVCAGAKPP